MSLWAWGSSLEQVNPFGLLTMKITGLEDLDWILFDPTLTTSLSGFTRIPNVAYSPLTVTCPSLISSSPPRREQTPASARNFCNLGSEALEDVDLGKFFGMCKT